MAALAARRFVAISRIARHSFGQISIKNYLKAAPILSCSVRSFGNSQHRVVLIPEIPKDTPDTNPILVPPASGKLPHFEAVTERHCYFGLGRSLLDFESAVVDFEQRCQKGIADFHELFGALEQAKVNLESVWSSVNLLILASDKLDQDRFTKLHDRAERALMSRHDSRIIYNHLTEMRASAKLEPYQENIIDRYLTEYRTQGFALPEKKHEELHSHWLKKLFGLKYEYNYRLIKSTERFQHVITDPNVVRDFPVDLLKAMAYDSSQPSKGPWTVTLHPYIYRQFLAYCPDRSIRYNAYYADVSRGSKAIDTYTTLHSQVREIRQTRLDQASALGFKSYAEMSMETKMAGTVSSVNAMISNLAGKAKARQEIELETLQAYAHARGFDDDIEVFDVEYFQRKQRRTILGKSDEDLRDFFPLPKVLDGVFTLCGKLFDVSFCEISDGWSKWHPDVKLFEVSKNGQKLGAFYLDAFIRDEKGYAGGDKGWYVPIRPRSEASKTAPLGALVMSLSPPNYGKPSLLNFFEVKELLRNFGSLLQHLLCENEFSDTCGKIGLEWDALDFVSNFMAEWAYHPDVIRLVSGHWSSSETLSEEIVGHLSTSIKQHMAGYHLCNDLFRAAFDIAFYSDEAESYIDVEENLRKQYLLLPKINGDVSPLYLSDMMTGDRAAGLFCSIWSRMLAADAFSAVEEAYLTAGASDKPVYDIPEVKVVTKRFHTIFLASGSSRPMAETFRKFRGRDPSHEALLVSLGLVKIPAPKIKGQALQQ